MLFFLICFSFKPKVVKRSRSHRLFDTALDDVMVTESRSRAAGSLARGLGLRRKLIIEGCL